MFGETPRNKMLRKMPLHSYPHKSYLPILDSIELERTSLLRMLMIEFNIVYKAGIPKNTKMSNILYPGFTCEIKSL